MDFVRHLGPYHVYLVPHSHLDIEWYWTFDKTRAWARKILRDTVSLLDDHPEETFAQDQTPILELLAEQSGKDKGHRLREWIESGRFELLGGYVQPEVAEPAGECLIRQFVLGRRRSRELFKLAPTVAWLIDTFGQVPQIPQIAVGCGMESYVFMRGVPRRIGDVPTAFWCEAPDGTRILTYWMASGYTTSHENLVESLKEEIAHASSRAIMIGWGADVTNPADAPAALAKAALARAAVELGLPVESITASTPGSVFRVLREAGEPLPVVREDFAPVDDRFADLRGTYVNRTRHKIASRLAETKLIAAEAWNALALDLGGRERANDLEFLWERLLFSQFHDTIGGSCTDQVYEKALKRCNTVIDLAEDITDAALDAIANQADTRGLTHPLLVFNPSSFPRTDIANFEMVFRDEPTSFRVTDSQGRAVPFALGEVRGSKLGTTGAIATAHVSWLAEDVPPFGFRVFSIEPLPGGALETRHIESGTRIENEFFRVGINSQTGDIAQITEIAAGADCLSGPGNAIAARSEENPNLEGHLGLTGEEVSTSGDLSPVAVEVEKNDLFQRITTIRDFLGCRLIREATLFRGVRRVHLRTSFKGFAGGNVLVSVRFPAKLVGEGELIYETPFAMTRRDRAFHCAQNVVDIHDTHRGLALVNTGNAGYFPSGNVLDLVLFRSLRNFPDYFAPLANEHGDSVFEYALVPHAGDWREGDVIAHGHAVNNPFSTFLAGGREGADAETHSLLSVSPESVHASAVKRSDDGSYLVVRIWETTGAATQTRLTVHLPFTEAWSATMEETPEKRLDTCGREISIALRRWEIATILIKTPYFSPQQSGGKA